MKLAPFHGAGILGCYLDILLLKNFVCSDILLYTFISERTHTSGKFKKEICRLQGSIVINYFFSIYIFSKYALKRYQFRFKK